MERLLVVGRSSKLAGRERSRERAKGCQEERKITNLEDILSKQDTLEGLS